MVIIDLIQSIDFFREMFQAGAWPKMTYLSCDDYDGSNTPERGIDLKSYFVGVKEI